MYGKLGVVWKLSYNFSSIFKYILIKIKNIVLTVDILTIFSIKWY